MKAWWHLYRKEIINLAFFILIVFLLITMWLLFLAYKLGRWPGELVFGLSFLPLSFFPLIMLWQGYQSFRYEWKDDTAYFLLTLPRPGWQITLSKLAAGMTIYIVFTIYTIISIYVANRDFIGGLFSELPANTMEGELINVLLQIIFLYIIAGMVIYILAQFSYLISRFYNRFNGVISIVIFILSVYILHRGGSILAPIFRWMPDIPIHSVQMVAGITRENVIYIGSSPFVGSFIMLIFLFLLGSWFLENYLEV